LGESVAPHSILFITLDSCRYDTFERASVPNLKKVGPLHAAKAPSYFTCDVPLLLRLDGVPV
jgi:hypothetical protein